MTPFQSIIRPDLLALSPYSSARSLSSEGGIISLDANECPWTPDGSEDGPHALNRYPIQQPQALLQRLAAFYGVSEDTIYAGRGSDEGIDLLVRLCCRAGVDSILVCPPTFAMYEFSAQLQDADVQAVSLKDDLQLDVSSILKACTDTTKLIFIPSPHAPLGHLINENDILQLCRTRAGKSLVVVDEAYAAFSSRPDGLIAHLKTYENLVILRTLSKAHALAGERLGCVIAAPELIAPLRRIAPPYPLPQSVIASALRSLSASGLARARDLRRILVDERQRMEQALSASPLIERIYPSEANFLMLQTRDAGAFMALLASFGIRARQRADMPGCVRLTIGTPAQNDAVLQALDIGIDKALKNKNERFASVTRETKETAIDLVLNLDHFAPPQIETGIGFFDHMLEQVATHGHFFLQLTCKGDLHVDAHHTIEDCGLALGEGLRRALGDKKGVARFAFTAPLDEAVARLVLDLSGRASAHFEGQFPAPLIGAMPSDMVPHFFASLASTLHAALHVEVKGDNAHHMAEACFKSLGRALREAVRREGDAMPSTKGVL